jgi:hypothetical protein
MKTFSLTTDYQERRVRIGAMNVVYGQKAFHSKL